MGTLAVAVVILEQHRERPEMRRSTARCSQTERSCFALVGQVFWQWASVLVLRRLLQLDLDEDSIATRIVHYIVLRSGRTKVRDAELLGHGAHLAVPSRDAKGTSSQRHDYVVEPVNMSPGGLAKTEPPDGDANAFVVGDLFCSCLRHACPPQSRPRGAMFPPSCPRQTKSLAPTARCRRGPRRAAGKLQGSRQLDQW